MHGFGTWDEAHRNTNSKLHTRRPENCEPMHPNHKVTEMTDHSNVLDKHFFHDNSLYHLVALLEKPNCSEPTLGLKHFPRTKGRKKCFYAHIFITKLRELQYIPSVEKISKKILISFHNPNMKTWR